jgi:flagellar motor switch/type III secretory pathway protein FliN
MSDRTLSSGLLIDGTSAQPLAWWPPARLDQVARSVQAAWSDWMADWISTPAPVCDALVCTLAHHSPGLAAVQWAPLGSRGRAAAWIQAHSRPVDKIQRAIFEPDDQPLAPAVPEASIALAVATSAWEALADTLRECLYLDCNGGQASPAPGVFKPWSGCVLVSPPHGSALDHSLLLNAECARGVLGLPDVSPAEFAQPQRGGMTKLEEALAEHKLRIQAELAGCELDLGELENLRVGDIVPLAHPLDEPLLVSAAAEGPFCAAFLGRAAGSKAIELVRGRADSPRNANQSPSQEIQ